MIKYYFSTFSSKKHFEKQLLSQYQTCSKILNHQTNSSRSQLIQIYMCIFTQARRNKSFQAIIKAWVNNKYTPN